MASSDPAPHGAASNSTTGRMAGKVTVITGGASGIGRACGLRFASEGASIVVADLNPDRAASVVDEINAVGSDAIAVQVDTSQQEQNDAMADAAVDAFGRIDACVAAAGISHSGYVSREIEDQAGQDRFDRGDMFFIDKSLESWQRVLDVNLTGVMLTNQAVARKMRDNGGAPSSTSRRLPAPTCLRAVRTTACQRLASGCSLAALPSSSVGTTSASTPWVPDTSRHP